MKFYLEAVSGRIFEPQDYTGLFQKKHFFGQKISKILCLAFDFICIYYMSSDY